MNSIFKIIKKENKKSQVSFEFIIILSIVLLILLSMLNVYNKYDSQYSSKKAKFLARNFAESISTSINQIYLSGDSTQSTFFLPKNLDKTNNYTLDIFPSRRLVQVNYLDERASFPILTSNITLKNLSSRLSSGTYLIQNEEQTITITKK
jgi:uncharacterized protein (UPF0333 family)